MLHTLLLNSTYECIAFIPERRAIKLLIKDKVEVVASWDKKLAWSGSYIYHPSILRLKHHVRWLPRRVRFNRIGIFKRDQHICQYCGKSFPPAKLTMDHVFPKSRGGDSSWKNCTTACFPCNNKKGDRTPEEAGMPPLKRPATPYISILSEFILMKNKHPDWEHYIPR